MCGHLKKICTATEMTAVVAVAAAATMTTTTFTCTHDKDNIYNLEGKGNGNSIEYWLPGIIIEARGARQPKYPNVKLSS